MKKLLAVFALVLGFTSVSQAGLLLEPYIGYESGTFKDFGEGKLTGTQIGARVAYTLPVFFWVGVDAATGSGTFKPDVGNEETGTRTTVGAVVGVDFPILLRAWASYGFMNELSFDSKLKGKNYKVGVGFTGLPFVSLNVEYMNETFDDIDGITLPTAIKNDAYIVSVSLPFEI